MEILRDYLVRQVFFGIEVEVMKEHQQIHEGQFFLCYIIVL